jgi:hypothetical protein
MSQARAHHPGAYLVAKEPTVPLNPAHAHLALRDHIQTKSVLFSANPVLRAPHRPFLELLIAAYARLAALAPTAALRAVLPAVPALPGAIARKVVW